MDLRQPLEYALLTDRALLGLLLLAIGAAGAIVLAYYWETRSR